MAPGGRPRACISGQNPRLSAPAKNLSLPSDDLLYLSQLLLPRNMMIMATLITLTNSSNHYGVINTNYVQFCKNPNMKNPKLSFSLFHQIYPSIILVFNEI